MAQKLLLKKKKKTEQKQETKNKFSSSQKVALHAVQKQLQLLRLKEWLIIAGFIGGGAALRSVMQPIPSAEPITFFAILAGWLFGKKKGFITGAAAGYLSNFIMFGGQGPWTIFQMLGWGMAGFLGGFIRNIRPKKNYFAFWLSSIIPVLLIGVTATLLFEVTLNVGWTLFFPYSIFALFLSGLPFLIIHLISNAAFSLFLPFARKFTYEKGKFNEVDICNSIVSKLNSSGKLNRLLPGGKTAEQPRHRNIDY
ncbi:MAG: ECF transporter S component [Nanoarchaeota archaeon]|nr:ECF transporter S component [Nanoarchaeota archaeon]